jgi:hypothetical protein
MAGLDFNHQPTTFEQMMLVDDSYDKQLVANCHPLGRVNPTPAGNTTSW